ncbi:MAG TPA: carbohydrate kinase family protein [Terriglobales bacterium]|nr:carbohydrate kinase family protein [Terriglobales bacterium]
MAAEEKAFDVVGLGLIATDRLITVPRFPRPGDKVAYSREQVLPGGQVAGACVVARRFGFRASFGGSVGDDEEGGWQAAELAREGIDASRLRRVAGCRSQRAWIFVEEASGERTIVYERAAALAFPAAEVDAGWIASGRLLHLDGHDGAAAARAAELARAAGVPVSADLANLYERQRADTLRLLRAADYLIASEGFARQLFGPLPADAALQRLRGEFGIGFAALTLGAEGVLARAGAAQLPGGRAYIPGFAVAAVDTTGAGDVLHGGFLVGLLRGWAAARALEFACALAALNCTAPGARGHIAGDEEVAALLRAAPRRARPGLA